MARIKINPILLISPLDPTCQSGLVKDAILLNQLGKTSIAICTAIANQNDVEIDDLNVLSFEEIKRQLDAIGRRYWLDWAVLSGIHDLNLVASIIRYLEQFRPGIQILWNPVLCHSERSYQQPLNKQEQELFDSLCKKVHSVFLEQRDLTVLAQSISLEERLLQMSTSCCLYLSGDQHTTDSIYWNGSHTKQSHHMTDPQRMTFLSTLSSFLYDGKERDDAYRQSILFLSGGSIN